MTFLFFYYYIVQKIYIDTKKTKHISTKKESKVNQA